mgnify:CR=1 FL=1
MAARALLQAEVRTEKGKTAANRLRKKGYLTANLYGKDTENIDLIIPTREFEKRFGKDITPSTIIELQIGKDTGGGTRTVILKEWQKDEFKQEFMHIDFQQISLREKIKLDVPIHLVGEAVGIAYGGVLQNNLRTMEIEAVAANVPQQIEVDVSHLAVGDQILVRDLPVMAGIVYLNDPEELVVAVGQPTTEKSVEPEQPVEEPKSPVEA